MLRHSGFIVRDCQHNSVYLGPLLIVLITFVFMLSPKLMYISSHWLFSQTTIRCKHVLAQSIVLMIPSLSDFLLDRGHCLLCKYNNLGVPPQQRNLLCFEILDYSCSSTGPDGITCQNIIPNFKVTSIPWLFLEHALVVYILILDH